LFTGTVATVPWEIQKSHFQKKTNCYPPPKNVTALPCKMKKLHLTEDNVAFLQVLVTLKRAGCGLVALKMTDQRD